MGTGHRLFSDNVKSIYNSKREMCPVDTVGHLNFVAQDFTRLKKRSPNLHGKVGQMKVYRDSLLKMEETWW